MSKKILEEMDEIIGLYKPKLQKVTPDEHWLFEKYYPALYILYDFDDLVHLSGEHLHDIVQPVDKETFATALIGTVAMVRDQLLRTLNENINAELEDLLCTLTPTIDQITRAQFSIISDARLKFYPSQMYDWDSLMAVLPDEPLPKSANPELIFNLTEQEFSEWMGSIGIKNIAQAVGRKNSWFKVMRHVQSTQSEKTKTMVAETFPLGIKYDEWERDISRLLLTYHAQKIIEQRF